MAGPPDSPNPLSNLLHTILSYDGNFMLAAVVSLLLVILFVLLLYVYAKWFLAHTRHRRRRSSRRSHVLGPPRFHHFNTLTFDTTLSSSSSITKGGLETSAIASIPLFVYDSDSDGQNKHEPLECVVCLSVFEEREVGRELPKCGHAFHAECIDMWLRSHSNCPICRAPVVVMAMAACESYKVAEIINSTSSDLVREEELLGATSRNEEDSSALEIVVVVTNSDDNANENGIAVSAAAACSSSSLSSQVASALGGSLKRMLSRNRSERRIHPSISSSSVNEESDE